MNESFQAIFIKKEQKTQQISPPMTNYFLH